MLATGNSVPSEMMVLMNHIYEFKKGVRHLVLYTLNRSYVDMATERLAGQNIPFILQDASDRSVNIYFGRQECLDAIQLIVTKPLNLLSPEEDFILGALLGYDLRMQCERFCKKKGECCRCGVCHCN